MSYRLRPYQQEDLDATLAAFERHRRVLGVAATGLGKAVVIQALAGRFVERGKRVLVLADMGVLCDQLARTIRIGTGIEPAIERADERADGDIFKKKCPIVVSTVQTQFSGPLNAMRCKRFDPNEFGLVVADEAEAFIAPKYRAVLRHYINADTTCKLFGCTATPVRSDGQAMGTVFQSVAFNRDIRWGVEHGYLVPPRQGEVRVHADWSTLRTSDGDYTDSSLSAILIDLGEQKSLEWAKGIVDQAGDKRSIVVLPKVRNAVATAHFINSCKPGSARSIHGEMADDEVRAVLEAHKAGEFQFLCSVNMLTKGYDDPGVCNVFMCRPTKARRLYTQVLGRGTRMIDPTIGGLPTVEERRAAIAASSKPHMTMFNLVGICPTVKDLSIVDVLAGREIEPSARALAAKRLAELPQADAIAEIERAIAEDAAARERLDAERRERVRVEAEVLARFSEPFSAAAAPDIAHRSVSPAGTLSENTVAVLVKNKVPDHVIRRLSPAEAGRLAQDIVRRHKLGLATYGQYQLLKRKGIDAKTMTKAEASRKIDEILNRRSA